MFQYLGEITNHKNFKIYGILTTHVTGINDGASESYEIHTRIPHENTSGNAEITVLFRRPDVSTDFSMPARLTIPMVEGNYEKTTFNALLSAHSAAIQELRKGVVPTDSRLMEIVISESESIAQARKG